MKCLREPQLQRCAKPCQASACFHANSCANACSLSKTVEGTEITNFLLKRPTCSFNYLVSLLLTD